MYLPDNLLSSVSREGLGALIEDDDIALHIGGDDAVHRTGYKICEEFIGFPEFIFNAFALGDIAYIGVYFPFTLGNYCLGDAYFYISRLSSCRGKFDLRTGLFAITFGMGKKLCY